MSPQPFRDAVAVVGWLVGPNGAAVRIWSELRLHRLKGGGFAYRLKSAEASRVTQAFYVSGPHSETFMLGSGDGLRHATRGYVRRYVRQMGQFPQPLTHSIADGRPVALWERRAHRKADKLCASPCDNPAFAQSATGRGLRLKAGVLDPADGQ